jgi:hypothetical protein
MITGAHSIIYSKDADADRAFLREVLRLPHADAGGGWLIFGLPPAELAVHPAEHPRHELYLMCDDVAVFVRDMAARNIVCAPVTDQRWGLLTELTLPGGGRLGIYQPRHARPPQAGVAAPAPRARARRRPLAKKKTTKKPAPRKTQAKRKLGRRR